MLDRQKISDIALELRECQKRINALVNSLKQERDREKELYKELDKLMNDAVDNHGRDK